MIETRLFHYFLTIASEGNITRAAEQLFITQSTLSKQMQELEKRLGKQLFIRGKRHITLTEEGEFFKSKAQDILRLVEQTETAFKETENLFAGDIYIGTAEVPSMLDIANQIHFFQDLYPDVRFHLISGDAQQILEYLNIGLIDFALLLSPPIQKNIQYTRLSYSHRLGILLPKNHTLLKEEMISANQLTRYPLIIPQQFQDSSKSIEYWGHIISQLQIVATYNLLFNALFLAQSGIGILLALEGMNELMTTDLEFRPLEPTIKTHLYLLTKKLQQLSPATKAFIKQLQQTTD